jgi:hypothetical protein
MKRFTGMAASLSLCVLTGACVGVEDRNVYYADGTVQVQGAVSMGPTYSFRFVEKWRISHAWIQGTGVRRCRYTKNIFQTIPGYPELSREPNAALFEKDGDIFYAGQFYKNPGKIVFYPISQAILGRTYSDRGAEKFSYGAFCHKFFDPSRHGIQAFLVKPSPAGDTDDWIKGAAPTQVNGHTWLVKKTMPQDLSVTGELAKPIEQWTLKIPDTPYWLHFRIAASLDHSILLYPKEHAVLLNFFRQIIDSVKLEPIQPVSPDAMPPFVIFKGGMPETPLKK